MKWALIDEAWQEVGWVHQQHVHRTARHYVKVDSCTYDLRLDVHEGKTTPYYAPKGIGVTARQLEVLRYIAASGN